MASKISVPDGGESEKIFGMITLGFGSLVAGMLSAIMTHNNRHRFPLSTTVMLCFGAGVLLATALVHILPEVQQEVSSNLAVILLCGGFFIIYFIDEFIHYFFGEAIQHAHIQITSTTNEQNHRVEQHQYCSNYGSLETEASPLLQENSSLTNNDHYPCDDEVGAANARICHTSHKEPCVQKMTATLGLFVALSLHSIIEGLAIGVQNSASKVLFLLGAVACHKFVMAFCLGLEFRSNSQATLRSQFFGMVVFSLGTVCGIGLGMIIVDIPTGWSASALPIIQAIAGGTIFYITVCEILPREKARWHQNTAARVAGFAQFIAVFCGFAIICILDYYLESDNIRS